MADKSNRGFIGCFDGTMDGKEKKVMIIDGITTCCGYDFGKDASNKKIKYCPICGKKIGSVKK